jgi:hypothetical protein
MKKEGIAATVGVGIGAALMYVFDPERGKRRRALVRDKLVHAGHATAQKAGVATHDAANHLRGVIARTRSLVKSERVADSVIAERVRARIGHRLPQAGLIDVTVRDGRVTLAGEKFAGDADALLSEVAHVRGVAGIDNKLGLGLPAQLEGVTDPSAGATPSLSLPVEGRRETNVATVS